MYEVQKNSVKPSTDPCEASLKWRTQQDQQLSKSYATDKKKPNYFIKQDNRDNWKI